MSTIIKICGLKTPETLAAAINAGADWVAFNFFMPSPRFVPLEVARLLGYQVKHPVKKIALLVDSDDDAIAAIIDALKPDMLQLHGSEAPERVAAIRATFGLPLIKAVGISNSDDIKTARGYETVADWLLLDAKPPKGADLPGGNGVRFDWHLLAGLDLAKPFMVSGGLDPANIAEAIRISAAQGVDVSSGVESAPGVKDPVRIKAFIEAAREADKARLGRNTAR
jgi:phosphoribosylanthranilate isomerase